MATLLAVFSQLFRSTRGFLLKEIPPKILPGKSARASIIMMSSTSSSPTLPPLSDRCLDTLDPCVVLMKNMISEYQHLWKDDEIYSLAQGVVYWSPPESTFERIDRAVSSSSGNEQLHMYCEDEGLLELRQALQHKLAIENLLPDQDVIVTAGANQAFMNVVMALLSVKSQCVVFRPYYFNHVMAVQLLNGNDGLVIGDCDEHGIPDAEWLERTLSSNKDVRIVTLVNPGNPTGVSLSRNKVQEMVGLCAKYNVWLVLDCTYEHFDHTNTDPTTFPCFHHPHVIHIFSFSKGHAIAGFRCGYIAINNQSNGVYQQMLKVQDTIPICPSRMSQIAALGALDAGREWVNNKVATLDAGREAILDAMKPLNPIMGGTGAMYVMGKLPEHLTDDQDTARRLVRDFGVAVIPGSFCGFPGWVRVCYSNLPPEKCKLAAARLAEGLETICSSTT
jgi:aspartate/methionine/tyrosine aminotransferase